MRITPSNFVGVAGILATPATPDASHWSSEDTVNLSETEKMTRLVLDAGIEILMTTGTFGEGATLTEREFVSFVECVAQTTAGRSPVFAGVTTLNTRDTITRARRAMAVGADGLFVGRPMWLALDDVGIVRFYRDLADALPGVPLVVYDNPVAFKGKISREAYLELAKIKEVVAAKHVGGPALIGDAAAVGEHLRVLPLGTHWYDAAKAMPDLIKACWSGSVACAPAPIAALSKAILSRNWDLAAAISEKCNWAESAMFAGGDLAAFMNYSIPIAHQRFASAGLIDPGPPRPPYLDAPARYMEGGLECGRRWAVLEKEYMIPSK
ncbi:MAG: dihydrodipicolinate synthase family protein [Xanthobacteraceae bacterium]|nr:dihydrodipicolinate synthase family protein [Xanthobacteraceae bacterium]